MFAHNNGVGTRAICTHGISNTVHRDMIEPVSDPNVIKKQLQAWRNIKKYQ